MGGQIHITQRVVFEGWRQYKLAVGCCLQQAPNGDILAWWLSGSGHEPATDNCVLMARSSDGGKTWGEPRIIVPAGEEAGALMAMQATSDGRLIALGARWPSAQEYTVWHCFRMESGDNGFTWSDPESLALRPAHNVAPGGRLLRLDNGEWLIAASFFEKRPAPLRAEIAALAGAKSEAEALALPPAPDGKCPAGKFGTHLHGCSVFISDRDDFRGLTEHGHIANRPLGLLEPTIVQLKNGRLVMFARAECGGFLWRTESADRGRTWTEAVETDIPNPTSLPFLIRLADERIALIHNNTGGRRGLMTARSPLSIWISDDELASWSIKADIVTRTPVPRPDGFPADQPDNLAYPNGLVLADGRFVFGYDRNRRQAMFVEVEIQND